MANNIAHFAIQADNVARAKAFYETCFGWRFEAWGPPDFYNITTGEGGIQGALYGRREPLTGTGMRGYRCTIAVDDVEAARERVLKHGATLTSDIATIPGVGALIEFADPEGNIVCAMKYERAHGA